MPSTLMSLGLVLLIGSSVVAGTTRPAPATAPVRLSGAELAEQIRELGSQLPRLNIKSPPPTASQQAQAARACRFHEKARTRRHELDAQARLNLSLLGIRAGFGAGDPEVMLSAAKSRWELAKQQKPTDYDGYALAWAGVFAGDAPAAKEGLRHIVQNSSQKPLAAWARGMLPIAAACGVPAKLSFDLLDGGKLDLQRLRGKVVVLHFWASWSSASIGTISSLKSFHEARRGDKNFMLVGISMDRTESAVQGRIRLSGMDWPQTMDGSLRRRFLGRGAPHIAVISPAGHILWQGHPGLKDTVVFTTDFARRQAGRTGQPKTPTTRPKPRDEAPAKRPGPKPTAQQELEAAERFKQARIYMKLRMRQRAREVLEEIVRKYPGTRAAAEARVELRYWH